MKIFKQKATIGDKMLLGGDRMVLIAGPCAVENKDLCFEVAEELNAICQSLDITYVFKASFDKANRTALNSFRSIGIDKSLQILQEVKNKYQIPVLTDVHETHQIDEVASVVDIIQIPAFLCRQTDLLVTAGQSGKAINIKRGQFMAPEDMAYAVEKVRSTDNQNVCLTERGVSFGYHNLVVDIRALPIMRQYCPVIYDVTHSLQQPGGAGGASGGQKEFAPYLARAAAAAGVDGFFIEAHPDPPKALSDGANMIALQEIGYLIKSIHDIWMLTKNFAI